MKNISVTLSLLLAASSAIASVDFSVNVELYPPFAPPPSVLNRQPVVIQHRPIVVVPDAYSLDEPVVVLTEPSPVVSLVVPWERSPPDSDASWCWYEHRDWDEGED